MTQSNFVTFQKLSVIAVSSIFLIAFSGCAKYKPHSFSKPAGQKVEKNNVRTGAQLLSDSDCQYYFSRNVSKKGYQPVQLYVQNKSDQSIILDASTINLPVENKDYVAECLHIDAVPRVAGWGAGGLFIWPLLVPAIVEAIEVPRVNKTLDKDFESRTLDSNSKITIKPHATMNKVFFVRKENVSDLLQFDIKNAKMDIITNFDIEIS